MIFFQLMNIKRRPGNGPGDYCPMPEGSEAHWEVVERMLFIFAMLNPGQSYVQGMNEIIGHIYYTFACDPNMEFRSKFFLGIIICIVTPRTLVITTCMVCVCVSERNALGWHQLSDTVIPPVHKDESI